MHKLFKMLGKKCKKNPAHAQCAFTWFFLILGGGAVFSWLLFLLPGIIVLSIVGFVIYGIYEHNKN